MIHVLDLKFLGQKETIAAFLFETTDGPVLFETGPHSTYENLSKAVKKAGFSIEDIKHVFVTHVHFDHAGAAWALAKNGATIYAHPSGAKHLKDPEKLYNSAKRIYGKEMKTLWGDMEPIPSKQVVSVKHDQKIKIGKSKFRALHTPGHATHHVAWEYKKILFAGDVGGVKIGKGIVVPPCPPPDINVEDWSASIGMLLNKRFDAIYLTHFGEVKDVKLHLVELRGRVKNWANWIKPYYEAGKSQKKVVPLFQEYVLKQLKMGKVSDAGLKKYEGANPSGMSVAGLYRYWEKKEEAIKNSKKEMSLEIDD